MASKGSAGAGLSKEDTKTEHPLQAILLADAWGEEQRWGPLVRRKRTDDEEYEDTDVGGEQRPWCLLPLLDTPLLAWSLECLASSGVQQVFIFVREGVEEVRTWLSASIYSGSSSPLQIILRPTKAATPGDVLREVDSLQILAPADYLVVQAGYVGNVNLAEKVQEFAERRKKDPSMTMSCVVAPTETKTTSTFAIHAVSNDAQLYHYEQSSLFPSLKQARLPREAIEGGKEIHVRADLESIGVAICSVEVAPLFTENFDYQFFYPDFVNGLLTSDLLGKTICCTIIGEDDVSEAQTNRRSASWAAVVGNTRSYDAVSKAILSRKAYPLAPDENMPEDGTRYEQRRGRVYYGEDLELSRTCSISSTSLLGSSVSIGASSTITRSVLSSAVHIGANCRIINSYLFPGAIVGDDCEIRDSVLGEGARVESGSVVESGSLVAAGAVLGKGTKLLGRRVSLEEPPSDAGPESGILGPDSIGFLWPPENEADEDSDDDDEDEVDSRNYYITRLGTHLGALSLGNSSTSSLSSLSRSSSSTSLSSSMSDSHPSSSLHPTDAPAIQGLESLMPDATSTKQSDFLSECRQSLDRSFAEGHTVDNAAIELKTLRMASNVPLGEVREFVIPYVLERCGEGAKDASAVLDRWGGLVANLTGDQEEAMEHCLLVAQKWIAEQWQTDADQVDIRFWLRVLKGFYETDVVTDEAAFGWYKSPEARSIGGEKGKALWAGARPFLEAIEEDSDSEEEDSE